MEPKPTPYGVLVQKAQYNEFCRVWVRELDLDELSSGLYGIKEHTGKNKNYYNQKTLCPRRLRILFMDTDHYIRVLLHVAVFSPSFSRPLLMGASIHYISSS